MFLRDVYLLLFAVAAGPMTNRIYRSLSHVACNSIVFELSDPVLVQLKTILVFHIQTFDLTVQMDNKYDFLKDLPVRNEENFKVYHNDLGNRQRAQINSSSIQSRNSIYLTAPNMPAEPVRAIVNEPKPQVTLKYLRVRGGQFSSQSQSCNRNPVKRSKTNCSRTPH